MSFYVESDPTIQQKLYSFLSKSLLYTDKRVRFSYIGIRSFDDHLYFLLLKRTVSL